MKILFLATHLNTGGISSYLFTLTKGLVKKGHHVHVSTSGGNMEDGFQKAGAVLFNVGIKTKSELSPKIYLALKPLKKYIFENNIDIIHSHTRITQVMGELLHRSTQRGYVSTCHGFFKPKISRRIFPCWGQGVIAISSAVREHLISDLHVPEGKIHLVESGVDIDSFHMADEHAKIVARENFHLGKEPIIGIIARLSDVKGQDILIKAMPQIIQEIPDVKLLIVGEGKTDALLKGIVSKLNIESSVRFLPIINHTAQVLPCFDIFVMPSRQEGLGLSVMEAQASGIPVVASHVGGIPSLIEHGKTGTLVDPENPQQLAKGIIDLIKNPKLRLEMSLRARDFIKKNYSADNMVDKTLRVYKNFSKHTP